MAESKIVITDADLLFIRGKMLLDTGDPGQAAKVFSELVNTPESQAKAWAVLGDIFQYRLLENEKAAVCYNKAMELDPQFAAAYLGYAGLLFATGRFAEANAMLNQAMDIPGAPADQLFFRMAMLKESQGRYDEAAADYRKSLLATFENKTIQACKEGMERCRIKTDYSKKSG
jgi:Tfp pilus assembly protein PilF